MMELNNFAGICTSIDLDESKLMLVFSLNGDDGQTVRYACTCDSFASGAGIDSTKLTIEDWRKFCTSIRGKRIHFKIEENSNE